MRRECRRPFARALLPRSGGTPSRQMPSAASALYTVKRPGMGTVTGMRRPSRRASKATAPGRQAGSPPQAASVNPRCRSGTGAVPANGVSTGRRRCRQRPRHWRNRGAPWRHSSPPWRREIQVVPAEIGERPPPGRMPQPCTRSAPAHGEDTSITPCGIRHQPSAAAGGRRRRTPG